MIMEYFSVIQDPRIERRDCAVSGDVDGLTKWHPNWKTIRSIETMREINDVQTSERRYFISSIEADPKLFMETVRAH